MTLKISQNWQSIANPLKYSVLSLGGAQCNLVGK
jgi:hypothetical protein